MGSDHGLRSRRLIGRSVTCKTVAFGIVTPALVGLLVISLLRSHHELPDNVRQLSELALDPLDQNLNVPISLSQDLSNSLPFGNSALSSAQGGSLPSQQESRKGSPEAEASSTGLTAQEVLVNEDTLPSLFLFCGILSGRGYRHRRLAVREAWANKAQIANVSVARFILSEDERTPQVAKEVDQHGDIVFVNHKTNYKSILYKTYYVLEYAVTNYNVKFVLKTDDDAFINVAPLMHQLHMLCVTQDCQNERIYMGKMAKESEVLLQPGHKWNNIIFHNHTGLRTYPTYAMGGGYVLSGDVARMLVTVNLKMKLKFTPIEDATLGFWLMSMDLRHIDHNRFHTWAAACCFKPPVRKEGQRVVTRFMLQEEIEEELCSNDPWLVLHKIDSPTKMRFMGNRVAQCNASDLDPTVVAPSIARFVGGKGGVDAEADEKEMQQAALAAAAAAANTDSTGASSAQGNKAVPVPRMKRSVEVLNAAAGQHLDAESATDKVAEKSAAQKLSEQIQEQQRLAGAASANQQEGNAAVQMPDDAAAEQGPDDAAAGESQQVDHTLPLQLPLQQQEQAVLPSSQTQVLSQAEKQQQTAAQAALTSLTK